MQHKEFIEIIEEISSLPDLNKDNIIGEIQKRLQEKYSDIYKEWEDKKFDIDHIFTIQERSTTGNNGLLHIAAQCRCTNIVQILLECGANTNIQDNKGDTLLHLTIQYRHPKTAKFL